MTTTTETIHFATDADLRITSGRLSDDQIRRARVLGAPVRFAGLVQIEVDGASLWGSLYGSAADRGLQLSPVVYPTREDANRASFVVDEHTTAAQIDLAIADAARDYDAAAD
jgi:hypothetical protein